MGTTREYDLFFLVCLGGVKGGGIPKSPMQTIPVGEWCLWVGESLIDLGVGRVFGVLFEWVVWG